MALSADIPHRSVIQNRGGLARGTAILISVAVHVVVIGGLVLLYAHAHRKSPPIPPPVSTAPDVAPLVAGGPAVWAGSCASSRSPELSRLVDRVERENGGAPVTIIGHDSLCWMAARAINRNEDVADTVRRALWLVRAGDRAFAYGERRDLRGAGRAFVLDTTLRKVRGYMSWK